MEDVLNATLSGGVIIGTTSDMMSAAWPVFLLLKRILNLYGIPGVLGGLAGVILAYLLGE